MIQIARNGEIIGTVSEAEFSEAIVQGRILATDHWWREGMADWMEVGTQDHGKMDLVSAELAQNVELAPVVVDKPKRKSAAGKREKPAEALTQKQADYLVCLGLAIPEGCTKQAASAMIGQRQVAQKRKWDAPATEKQLKYLNDLGCDYPDPCSKKEAARLIDEAVELEGSEEWMSQQVPARQRKMLEDAGFRDLPSNLTRKDAAEYFEDIRWKTLANGLMQQADEAYEARRKRLEPNPFWVVHEDVLEGQRALNEAIEKQKAAKEEARKQKKDLRELEREAERLCRLADGAERDPSVEIKKVVELRVAAAKIKATIDAIHKLDRTDYLEDLSSEREELKEAEKYRVGLWKISFTMNIDVGDEMDFLICGPVLQKMHDEVASLLKAPPVSVIKNVLKTLDEENQIWDRDNPALFYEKIAALENGKYLGGKGSKKGKQMHGGVGNSGCFSVVLCWGVLLLALIGLLIK